MYAKTYQHMKASLNLSEYINVAINGGFIYTVRLEVFKAGTMKNVVFWDIKIQLVPHRKHIISSLQNPAG
jgi:hypothetical protein